MTDPFPLPASVLDLVEIRPVEDLLLHILHEGLPDVPTFSLIPDSPPPNFILARGLPGNGLWRGDERFVQDARFYIHTFTSDPDGDWKGATLSEATRVVLREASTNKWGTAELGWVNEIKLDSEAGRVTDWATSVGPVQYADLPTGYWRYQSIYHIKYRKPRQN